AAGTHFGGTSLGFQMEPGTCRRRSPQPEALGGAPSCRQLRPVLLLRPADVRVVDSRWWPAVVLELAAVPGATPVANDFPPGVITSWTRVAFQEPVIWRLPSALVTQAPHVSSILEAALQPRLSPAPRGHCHPRHRGLAPWFCRGGGWLQGFP
ncbi:hypothetical protein H1C71_041943, partial [Ictidomys tridecemlineatus]